MIVILAGDELKHSTNIKQAIVAWLVNLILDAVLITAIVLTLPSL